MQILSDSKFQYTCNHNKFDTYCHVIVLLMCIPLFCKIFNHISSLRHRAEWSRVPGMGSNPARDIYFLFEFFAPFPFIIVQQSPCK